MYAAGERYGGALDLAGALSKCATQACTAQELADILLAMAIEADHGHPTDDTSVMVMMIDERHTDIDMRRMSVTFPF